MDQMIVPQDLEDLGANMDLGVGEREMREPLLLESNEGRQRRKVKKLVKRRGPVAQVTVFNEEEDTTKILRMIYLEVSYFKRIVVVPLLSIITGLFFLLFLYWYPNLRKRFLYNHQENVYKATHLFIEGTSKC